MFLVPRKSQVRPWSWTGLVMVILATPAIVLAALVAGLFALLISPLALASPRHWRTPARARRVGGAFGGGSQGTAQVPDQTMA